MEVFIKGYEDIYSINTEGEVFSYAKGTRYKRKLVPDKNGYLTVMFKIGGSIACKKVHRLVAEQFISNPENKSQVNHKNGIKTDRDLNPINSKYQIEVFNEEKYKTLVAQRTLNHDLEKLAAINKKGIKNPDIIRYAAAKISRIIEKIEGK